MKQEVCELAEVQKVKIKQSARAAVQQFEHIDALKTSYNAFLEGLADELGVDKEQLKEAGRRVYKQDFFRHGEKARHDKKVQPIDHEN
ncbi:hypothetical protein [Kluyvera intermedia]|uniref:hypothetical protein n=1 Tax=Kluyvera intermedia TaxID=61648 RepID=UPI0039F598B3